MTAAAEVPRAVVREVPGDADSEAARELLYEKLARVHGWKAEVVRRVMTDANRRRAMEFFEETRALGYSPRTGERMTDAERERWLSQRDATGPGSVRPEPDP